VFKRNSWTGKLVNFRPSTRGGLGEYKFNMGAIYVEVRNRQRKVVGYKTSKQIKYAWFKHWEYAGLSFKSVAMGDGHACGILDLAKTKRELTNDLARLALKPKWMAWKGSCLEAAMRLALMTPKQQKPVLADYTRQAAWSPCPLLGKSRHRNLWGDDPKMKSLDRKLCNIALVDERCRCADKNRSCKKYKRFGTSVLPKSLQ